MMMNEYIFEDNVANSWLGNILACIPLIRARANRIAVYHQVLDIELYNY